jgi:hypothetical protein
MDEKKMMVKEKNKEKQKRRKRRGKNVRYFLKSKRRVGQWAKKKTPHLKVWFGLG